MNFLTRCSAALFAISLLALSTGAAPAVQPMWGGGGSGVNLSGMYSGSVTDSALGTGSATANFAHSGGSSGGDPLGGWMSFTFGTTTYNNPTSASRNHQGCGGQGDWCGGGGGGNRQLRFMDGGGGSNTVHGIFVSIIGSAACEFAFKASFNTSSYQLSGEYEAKNGCSGQSGTFLLTQQCYYDSLQNVHRRTGSGPGPCT